MKFFNQINDITMRIAKGMVAIFVIKLTLLLAIFTFNACTSENLTSFENNAEDFEKTFDLSLNSLNSIGLSNSSNFINARFSNETKTLSLVKDEGQTLDDTSFLNSINDLNSLVDIQQEKNLTISENPDSESDILGTYVIEEQPILDALAPSIVEARNYLINTKGFTNQEIDEMIIEENGQEEDLGLYVKHLISIENEGNVSTASYNPLNLFVNFSYAQELTGGEIATCAAVAIGADILWSLGGSNASSWSIGAMKRAFGKVAARFLGPIGVAIAVVSFGLCILHEAQD